MESGGSRHRPAECDASTGNGLSMADNGRSYRSNDPYRRAAEPPRPSEPAGGDPLAELARLIGQSDPFAEFGRSNSRQAASARQPAPRPAPPIPEAYRPQEPEAYRPQEPEAYRPQEEPADLGLSD